MSKAEQKIASPPAISVVVPAFNKAAYIGRCLQSIREQTFQNFEIIVVDDGSTDGSAAVAEGIQDSRLRVIRQENRGEGAARNRGIGEAKAELIAFLDGDDEWDPPFLERILELARRYPDAGLLATGYRRPWGSGKFKEITMVKDGVAHARIIRNYLRAMRSGDFVTSSSAAVRRSALAEVGNFLEGEPIGADKDLWARIALRYPIAYDTRILATYHTDAAGRTLDSRRLRAWAGYGKSNSPYPPVVRTLRRALAEGGVPALRISEAKYFVDWSIMRDAYWLIDVRDRTGAERLLQGESFYTLRFRLGAHLLQFALKVLPMRIISALT